MSARQTFPVPPSPTRTSLKVGGPLLGAASVMTEAVRNVDFEDEVFGE
jgi:hypothetical protein